MPLYKGFFMGKNQELKHLLRSIGVFGKKNSTLSM